MYARMLQKAQRRGTGSASAKVHTLPAPIGGWNVRDAISAMKPEDAIILDNIIPDHGRVRLRSGFDTYATGLPGNYVETLMEYAPPTGVNKLFAAVPNAVYDVTSAGAVGAAEFGSQTNGRWQHTMMAALGGTYLCIVNGVDNYRTYNGSTWTDQDANILFNAAAFDTGKFTNIAIHMNRLWFVEKSSLNAYYLPTASITGDIELFPLGPLCKLGGSLLTIATWTKDAGDGMDDLIVFITTKGEVVVYQGTDPASATTWQLVGIYRVSEPTGKRCIIKVGGDLGIITSTGISLLSKLISVNLSGQKKAAITNKITRAFTDMYAIGGDNFGWQIQEFPSQALVLVNIPVALRETSYQYVINVETGGWCRFTGINALCWALKGEDLFFGGADGTVYQFGEALSDDGATIQWRVQMAYNRLSGNNNKAFRMARALMTTIANYIPGVLLLFNYDTQPPNPEVPIIVGDGPLWNTTLWNTALWGVSTEETSQWQSVDGEGHAVSVVLSGASAGVPLEFNQVDLMVEDASWI